MAESFMKAEISFDRRIYCIEAAYFPAGLAATA